MRIDQLEGAQLTYPRPFFILGAPRSGTTLLQSVCLSAEGVYVPPETHFLTRFPPSQSLKTPAQWERALREVERACASEGVALEGFRERAEELSRLTGRGHAQLLWAWLAASAQPLKGERFEGWVGEASNVHTRHTLTLAKLFPHAKLIHMIRDPRDVAASQREAWGSSLTRAALRWRDELLTHKRALQSLSAERYRLIYYERLVSAPKEEIKALCAWFGWPFTEQLTRPHQRAHKGFIEREAHKQLTLEPITNSRVGRWRHKLTAQEVKLIELICGPLMSELGYELSPPSLSLSARALPRLISEASEAALTYGSRQLREGTSSLKALLISQLPQASQSPAQASQSPAQASQSPAQASQGPHEPLSSAEEKRT